MGKDKSDYIAPLDSYNLTIAFAPVFMIIIILMIATGIIFGFNPIVDITISWTASIFIYMVIKNMVLVELELRKFRNKWKSGMRGKEDRQDDINDESYYSDSNENLGYLVITIVHFLILGIVLKTIYGFLLLAYPLIAFSSCALVCSVVEYLRYFLKKKHRSERRS